MNVDITSAQDIAGHIYQEVGTAEYPRPAEEFGLVAALGTDYVVQAGDARFSVGPDQQSADGICWAVYADAEEYDSGVAHVQGGWAFDDRETAEAEIAEIIALLTRFSA